MSGPKASKKKAASKDRARAKTASKKKAAGKKKAAAKKKAAGKKKATASKRAAAATPKQQAEASTPERQRPKKGRLVNRSELAEIHGVSLPTITSWVRRGCPYQSPGGRGKEWQFNTAEVADWREQIAYANAVGDASEWNLEEARRRREAAEAALKEIELAKARGEIVAIEAVADIVGDDYTRVRARLLTLPPSCAPLVYRAESVGEVREVLDDAVREALAELSAVAEEFGDADPEDSGEASEAAAETSGQ